MVNVLVTGIGTPLGQSIFKALRSSSQVSNIFVTDTNSLAAGRHLEKAVSIDLPSVRDEDYLEHLVDFTRRNDVKVIFPVAAAEHRFYLDHLDVLRALNINPVVTENTIWTLCNDKYLSMQFLREKGITAPDTELAQTGERLNSFLQRNTFPLVMKPRFGASSKNIFIVENTSQLLALSGAFPNEEFVIQQYINDPNDYTVGVYRHKESGITRSFGLSRRLEFGLSYSGSIIGENYLGYANSIAEVINSNFSINVQFKVMDGTPYTYEINPRLSSTTSIRAHFGFNEPEMIIREVLGLPFREPALKTAGSFMRYWDEIFLDKQ